MKSLIIGGLLAENLLEKDFIKIKMISEEEAEKIKKQLLAQLEQVPAEQADQAAALKEQIKQASPEQLEAFISQAQKSGAAGAGGAGECIFCQIIEGKLETVKIYEDSDILAILDINPASRGHMLVLPKKHFQFIHEIPDSTLNKIFIFVKTIESILKEVTGALGISIYIAQGELAGQRMPHFCVNLIPRYKDDKFSFEWPRQKIDKKKLEQLGEKLRKRASKDVKQKLEVEVKKEAKKKKIIEESEAEKIIKQMKRRMP